MGTERKDDEVEFPTYLANLEYGHWHVEQQRMQDKHFPSLMINAGYVHLPSGSVFVSLFITVNPECEL